MRNVILVAEKQLESVLPGGELDLCLGLPGAEMKVVEVIGDGLIQWRKRHINENMMMAGVFLVGACRRYAHPAQSEMDGRPRADRRAVFQVHEVNRGTRRRWRRTAALCESGDARERDTTDNKNELKGSGKHEQHLSWRSTTRARPHDLN